MGKEITKPIGQEEKKAELAHKRRESILRLKKMGSVVWLELGKKLYLVEKNKDWEILGGEGFPSMRAYMSAPEASGGLDLTRSWLMDFKCNYEKFIQELGRPGDQIAQLEPSKLRYIRPIVNKDNVEEWLERAKHLSRSDLIEEIKELNPPPKLPKGKYNVLLCDPPYPYPERQDEKNLYGNTKYHYKTMSIKEISELKVGELADKNSVLFLWVATNFLEESFEILKSWGFNYKSQMVWVKKGGQGGIGWYFWGDHELLLVATKGSFLPKEKVSSVLEAPRREHSRKPDEVYEIIEKMYPQTRKIELFARGKPKKGWTIWGDQANEN